MSGHFHFTMNGFMAAQTMANVRAALKEGKNEQVQGALSTAQEMAQRKPRVFSKAVADIIQDFASLSANEVNLRAPHYLSFFAAHEKVASRQSEALTQALPKLAGHYSALSWEARSLAARLTLWGVRSFRKGEDLKTRAATAEVRENLSQLLRDEKSAAPLIGLEIWKTLMEKGIDVSAAFMDVVRLRVPHRVVIGLSYGGYYDRLVARVNEVVEAFRDKPALRATLCSEDCETLDLLPRQPKRQARRAAYGAAARR